MVEERPTPTGTPTRSHVIGQEVLSQSDGRAVLYLLPDGHGSTRLVTDAAGAVLANGRLDYDAWGNAVGFDPSIAVTSVLYTGQRYDPAIGLYDLRARMYDPATGEFRSRDSFTGQMAEPTTLSSYLFNLDDPMDRVDPTGHESLASISVAAGISTALSVMDNAKNSAAWASAQGAVAGMNADQIFLNFAVSEVLQMFVSRPETWGQLGVMVLAPYLERMVLQAANDLGLYSGAEGAIAAAFPLGKGPGQEFILSYDGLGRLNKQFGVSGTQKNHLNQDAVYGMKNKKGGRIPYGRGLTINLRGDTQTPGSEHYDYHKSLDQFWQQFRPGGDRADERPTNEEYVAAVKQALMDAGVDEEIATFQAGAAAEQLVQEGYAMDEEVPDVPEPTIRVSPVEPIEGD